MKDDLISRLSEIRSQYNLFNESEEPYYRALSEVIKMLSEQADGDTIDRQAAIDAIEEHLCGVIDITRYSEGFGCGYKVAHRHIQDVIKAIPKQNPCSDCQEFDCYGCQFKSKNQGDTTYDY